tara:strand:- start:579 stop:839 length:261 start_codon:yes stop_codon:yes gene_type:complete
MLSSILTGVVSGGGFLGFWYGLYRFGKWSAQEELRMVIEDLEEDQRQRNIDHLELIEEAKAQLVRLQQHHISFNSASVEKSALLKD